MFVARGLIILMMGVAIAMAGEASEYDYSKDPFYSGSPITVTWVMIWNGATEKWWKESDYHGCKVLVDSDWQSINWNSELHIDSYCKAIRDAGINVIAVDFTNGFRWKWQAKRIQSFCHENKMKFAVAFNSQGGKHMESGCKQVWEEYASPSAPFHEAYLYKDGKPLVVLYTTRGGYNASVAIKDTYRNKFSTTWASGEDSGKDKWGWQLEPHVGPVSSRDSMFVTGSVKFNSPGTTDNEWRKNLAWLDYGLIKASESNPEFLIIGSFDDVHERNAWIQVDTVEAPKGWQMRDKAGALSRDAYYNRVCEWLKGVPSTVEGGLLPDGAYILKCSDGNVLGCESNRELESQAILKPYGEDIENLVWLYHLGENSYRLIKLNSGLAFEVKGSDLQTNWDSEGDEQRWLLEKTANGYSLTNKSSKEVLSHGNKKVFTEASDDASPAQRWAILPQAVIKHQLQHCGQGNIQEGEVL